jgi:hypothetical protein
LIHPASEDGFSQETPVSRPFPFPYPQVWFQAIRVRKPGQDKKYQRKGKHGDQEHRQANQATEQKRDCGTGNKKGGHDE